MSRWEQDYGFGPSDRTDLDGMEEYNDGSDTSVPLDDETPLGSPQEARDRACQRLREATQDYLELHEDDVLGLVKLVIETVEEI